MELKTTKNLSARIEKIMEDRENEKKDLSEQLLKISEEIEETENAIKEAIISTNAKNYQTARAKLDNLKIEKEFCEIKIDALDNKELITTSEYIECIESVKNEFLLLKNDTLLQLVKIAEDMAAITNEFENSYSLALSTLEKLQNDIYHNRDRRTTPAGEIIFLESENITRKIDGGEVLRLGYAAIRSGVYAAVTGTEQESIYNTKFW